jgi:monofunctional glycosyltransferase
MIKKIFKRIFMTGLLITGIAHVILFLVSGVLFYRLRTVNPEKTTLMMYREYQSNITVKPVTFVPLNKLPGILKTMTVAVEDLRFHEHHGIDIDSIKWAYYINTKVGYHMYGGSTITQQITRTLFLLPKKLLVRKYIEVLMALEMELFLPKERILELYLNYAEWGKGIFGFARAAEYHYKKPYYSLTNDEISRLIAILPSPLRYTTDSFLKRKFLANRYFTIKFRYYTFKKFQHVN